MIALIITLLLIIIALCFWIVRLNQLRAKHKTEAASEKVSNEQHLTNLQELQNKLAAYERREASRVSLEENDRDYLKELLVREERIRIAQELYDDTVARIVMTRFRIITAMHNEKPSPAKEQVSFAVRELQFIVDDLRFLIENEVRPVFETSDITLSLKNLAKEYNQIWLAKRVNFENSCSNRAGRPNKSTQAGTRTRN
jgi:signal transduction histidine kinase